MKKSSLLLLSFFGIFIVACDSLGNLITPSMPKPRFKQYENAVSKSSYEEQVSQRQTLLDRITLDDHPDSFIMKFESYEVSEAKVKYPNTKSKTKTAKLISYTHITTIYDKARNAAFEELENYEEEMDDEEKIITRSNTSFTYQVIGNDGYQVNNVTMTYSPDVKVPRTHAIESLKNSVNLSDIKTTLEDEDKATYYVDKNIATANISYEDENNSSKLEETVQVTTTEDSLLVLTAKEISEIKDFEIAKITGKTKQYSKLTLKLGEGVVNTKNISALFDFNTVIE